ncbi:RAG1-activating protein-1-related [Klebsormidium nitens]|uniref:RAG1-activating protein-1-related n=1 Tax=Klebsormidium nitens TaxID=105231 RepID=A0A0U9HIS6_KLENI|nr:RAG1-activating protein-1-related [Klebsormidium nitens]|eukprot:GAQ80999.1 RAG1-activating protein-1-related [Klebsormidium nitens]
MMSNLSRHQANCTSLSTALSPTPTFARIVKNRSTEKFSSTPYVASVFSNAIWLLYGLVTPNSLFVITISSVLVIIYGTYCALFWKHAVTFETRVATERLLFGAALVISVTAAITWGAVPEDRRTLLLGLFGDVLSVIQARISFVFGNRMHVWNVAAPLSVLGMVFRTKSAEYLPLPLCVNNLINNTVWGVYAILKADVFVGAPCIPAVLLALASVALIFHYGDGSKTAAGARAAASGTADVTYVGGGSMHGGVSVHRGASQRGRPNKLDMGAPLLERIDSMPESPTGTNGNELHSAVFVISDEEEVHGARNFHTPTQSGPQNTKGGETEGRGTPTATATREEAVADVASRRAAEKLTEASQGQSGARMPASFRTSVSRRSSFSQQEGL